MEWRVSVAMVAVCYEGDGDRARGKIQGMHTTGL